jgi:3-oxoacid CoA-transferase subunit B
VPLTGQAVVHRVITDLAVIDVVGDGRLILRETAPGVGIDEVRAATGTSLTVADQLISH